MSALLTRDENPCRDCGRLILVAPTDHWKFQRKAFNLPAVQGGRWWWDDSAEPPRMRHTAKPAKPATAVGYTLHHCSTEPTERAVWKERTCRVS